MFFIRKLQFRSDQWILQKFNNTVKTYVVQSIDDLLDRMVKQASIQIINWIKTVLLNEPLNVIILGHFILITLTKEQQ